ncbi:MAG: peptidoglycan/LPS O-acetylase OafA/YrhL [Crocinitomix sp.]|jgi:peptidoglycan/LPS O-acetylase OafA/YrhL
MPRNKRLHFKDIHALKALVFIPIYLYCILSLISATNTGALYEFTSIVGKISQSSFDFLFFLTAFLVTSHGLREYKYTDRFSLKNFYLRRILRLSVVLILALVFAFVLHPWLIRILDLQPLVTPSIEPYFLLIPNYLSDFAGPQLIYLTLICTVFMFLQFYIFWGIMMKFFLNHLNLIALILVGVGIVSRVLHQFNGSEYLMDTLSFGIPIGIGVITAVAVRNESTIVVKLKEISKSGNSFIYIIGCLLFLGGYVLTTNSYLSAIIPLFTGLFFGYVVIEQTFGKNSFVQFKTKKILSYLGKISYGMLVYQAIIGVMVTIAFESLDQKLDSFYMIAIVIIAGFIGTVVLADISFKLIEKPLLRIRREFKKV